MDEKTARRYLKLGKLPSEVKAEHDWSGHKRGGPQKLDSGLGVNSGLI